MPEPKLRLSVALAGLAVCAAAQERPAPTRTDEDVLKAGPVDPFTGGEAKAMAALGVVAYGPMPWADGKSTTDIEHVLGEGRILWLETAHFRIGCNLRTSALDDEPDARKILYADLDHLHKKLAKVPDRPKKLEPWLRLHLYGQRAEDLYADIADLTAFRDADGASTHLGQRDKFLVLLFQRKSDLARYLDRFCGRQSEVSQRHFHDKSGQQLVALCVEAEDPRDEPGLHAQFRFLLVGALLAGLNGNQGHLPPWLGYGLAHWYERQVPTRFINCGINADENVDAYSQHVWAPKVRARVQRDALVIPFGRLATMTDLGYFAHIQAWSRVDYLMQKDRRRLGRWIVGLKASASSARQHQLLEELFGIDGEQFDADWRAWVGKTYAK